MACAEQQPASSAFDLKQLLGVGTFAHVYGITTPAGESVAVKVLRQEHSARTGTAFHCFSREAVVLCNIKHR